MIAMQKAYEAYRPEPLSDGEVVAKYGHLVDRLARRFGETDGDLKEVARSLVTAPEAWSAPRQKF